jgi:hypothetical protein
MRPAIGVFVFLAALLAAGCVTVPAGWNDSVAANVTAVADAAAPLWDANATKTGVDECLKQCADMGAIAYQTARKVDAAGKVLSKNAALKLAAKTMQENGEFAFPKVMEGAPGGKLSEIVRIRFKVPANDADQVLGLLLAGINAKKGGA